MINIIFGSLILIIPILISIYVAGKHAEIVPHGEVSQKALTNNEKIYISILLLISPLISGAIFYYMWRRTLPVKARWANRMSFVVLGILIIFVFLRSLF